MNTVYHNNFLRSILFTLVGIYISCFLFPREGGLISIFLVSISLLKDVEGLFERNRKEIWGKLTTPFNANKKLALSLLYIFLGVVTGYALFTFIHEPAFIKRIFSMQLGRYAMATISIKEIDFGRFLDILYNNTIVLFVVLFFGLMYRIGGILLVILWNASTWSTILAYITKIGIGITDINLFYYLVITFICIFPHLIAESIGYVLCSMTGVFLSKGMVKYEIGSERFIRVVRASLVILVISFSFIILGAFLETGLTPRLIGLFLY